MENTNEVWKDIKGYPGYQISNYGRIWSSKQHGRYMKPTPNNRGYLQINLIAKNGKRKKELVHRLVAIAFIDNPNNYTEVHHIDANASNNTADNLEWINHKNNLNQKERLEKIYKKVLCIETNEVFNSIKEASISKQLQVSHIGEVCMGKRKTHGGYHWQFVEGGDAYDND